MFPDAPGSVLDCYRDQITDKIREGDMKILNMLNIFGLSPELATNVPDTPRLIRNIREYLGT